MDNQLMIERLSGVSESSEFPEDVRTILPMLPQKWSNDSVRVSVNAEDFDQFSSEQIMDVIQFIRNTMGRLQNKHKEMINIISSVKNCSIKARSKFI